MNAFYQALLILHFLGLAMGFSTTFANLVTVGLITKAAPHEKAVLGQFLLAMSRVAEIGVGLLWATGLTMVFTKFNGFGSLPWQFYVKLSAVVILTATLWGIHTLGVKVQAGDASAEARIQMLGKLAALMALLALVFAVLTFT